MFVVWLAWSMAVAGDVPTWADLAAAPNWPEVGRRNSDVGEVVIRHQRFTDIDCIEGRTVVPEVDLTTLVAVARDAESAMAWSTAGIVAAKVLADAGSYVDYYQYLDVPNWTLVADRYWILRGTVVKEPDTARFRWTRSPEDVGADARADALGRAENAIEPPRNVGEWVFQSTPEGTAVHYRACVDVGGSIPMWVQKFVATRTLPDTVTDLITEARRRAAKGAP